MTRRELQLLIATALIVLAGLSYLLVGHQTAKLAEIRRQSVAAELEYTRNQVELMRRPELLQNLERVRAQLPRHPMGRDVRSDVSRQIQSLARQSGLTLTGLTPEQEETLPEINLNQLSIRCSWNGTPEALVGFLIRLQSLGAVMDVRELRFRVSPRDGNQLTGSFIVDSAFSRVPADTTASTDSATPSPDQPPSP
ncbi:MAG: hypothetical protein JJU29_16550 [Verrucomicrobia bacterium]|nr:hypothetical protein [Verrucomicrobiota bacterium]